MAGALACLALTTCVGTDLRNARACRALTMPTLRCRPAPVRGATSLARIVRLSPGSRVPSRRTGRPSPDRAAPERALASARPAEPGRSSVSWTYWAGKVSRVPESSSARVGREDQKPERIGPGMRRGAVSSAGPPPRGFRPDGHRVTRPDGSRDAEHVGVVHSDAAVARRGTDQAGDARAVDGDAPVSALELVERPAEAREGMITGPRKAPGRFV